MKLTLSAEQQQVCDLIRAGENVFVDAVAGSGKSTTILFIAQSLPHLKICMVTYNSQLCKEIRQKVDEMKLDNNMYVHTYHSINVQYYLHSGYNDTSMRRVLRENMPPIDPQSIPQINLLVVDEAQDMTELYFKFLVKFCTDHHTKYPDTVIQVLILGDRMQGLYEFKGSDTRFLTRADELWRNKVFVKPASWHKCTLRMSYRITDEMGYFVNNVMLGSDRMLTCRGGVPVLYLRRYAGDAVNYIRTEIRALIRETGALPGDFFILAASVKSASPNSATTLLENALVEMGIPCYVPSFDEDKIDEKIIDGKVVFSTFHSVKGRQRKYVFVLGFDHQYFEWYGRDLCPEECPNTLYVACTRATHGLFLVECNGRPLKFLQMSLSQIKSQPFVKFEGIVQSVFPEPNKRDKDVITRNVTPTELIRFIPENVLEQIVPILDTIFVRETPEPSETDVIEIPSMIETSPGQYEDVSDLNGIAIPAVYFEHLFSDAAEHPPVYRENSLASIADAGKQLREYIVKYLEDDKRGTSFLYRLSKNVISNYKCENMSDYLYLTNICCAIKEKIHFKVKQITHYGWLAPDTIQRFFERMNRVFGEDCFDDGGELDASTEVSIISNDLDHTKIDQTLAAHMSALNDEGVTELFRFSARVDVVIPGGDWELKCTSDLTSDHFIQVVIYAWLRRMTTGTRMFRIMNIKTGEIRRLDAETDQLTEIVVLLLEAKYRRNKVHTDEDFMASLV